MTTKSDTPVLPDDPQDSGWTILPYELVDHFPLISSFAEILVILYVLRHTWGYQDYSGSRRITLDEFSHGRKRRDGSRLDSGTGLSRNAIKAGVRAAVAHGFLIQEPDDRDGGRRSYVYRLHMADDAPSPEQGDQPLTPSDPDGHPSLPPEGAEEDQPLTLSEVDTGPSLTPSEMEGVPSRTPKNAEKVPPRNPWGSETDSRSGKETSERKKSTPTRGRAWGARSPLREKSNSARTPLPLQAHPWAQPGHPPNLSGGTLDAGVRGWRRAAPSRGAAASLARGGHPPSGPDLGASAAPAGAEPGQRRRPAARRRRQLDTPVGTREGSTPGKPPEPSRLPRAPPAGACSWIESVFSLLPSPSGGRELVLGGAPERASPACPGLLRARSCRRRRAPPALPPWPEGATTPLKTDTRVA